MGSHNNTGGDATELDGVFLAAGDYTVEATTALSRAVGGYRITIEGDFAVRSPNLAAAVTATVGQPETVRFAYQPAAATVSVQSVTPAGLEAAINGTDGLAALSLTPDKARISSVTVAFTASGHASTRQITVTSYCQTGYRPSPDGTCRPLTPTLDQSCFQSLSQGRDEWGKRWEEIDLGQLFSSVCASVSVADRNGCFFVFEVPAGGTSRSTFDTTLQFHLPDEPVPFAGVDDLELFLTGNAPEFVPELPALDYALWRLGDSLPSAEVVPLVVDPTDHRVRVQMNARIAPGGTYLLEVVPRHTRQATLDSFPNVVDSFVVAAISPSIRQEHDDVRHLGNFDLGGSGASLGAFLDARGTTRYGASPVNPTNNDDLFDPESPDYPWLSFSVDRCSIPEPAVSFIDSLLRALTSDTGGIESPGVVGRPLRAHGPRCLSRSGLGTIPISGERVWRSSMRACATTSTGITSTGSRGFIGTTSPR